MNIHFWLRQNKINKAGLAPIYCRITIDGKRKDISTNYFISPNEWKKGSNRAKKDEIINEGLALLENDLFSAYHNLKRNGNNPGPDGVFNAMKKKISPSYFTSSLH